MKRIITVSILIMSIFSVGGCANRWDQQDDAKCKSWGMSGSNYLSCRQMLNNQRSAAFAQISSGLNQIGQSTSRANQPAIIPPCIDCRTNYQNY